MHVLIAPDSFGDSLTAVEAAQAIAAGWRRARPDDTLTLAPQSDGGPGFVGVLASRLGGKQTLRVSGPLTAEVSAEWVFDDAARTAYIECAQACGLALLGGRFDDQSLHGKVVSALAGAARARQIPVVVLAGQVTLEGPALRSAGITAAQSIAEHAGSVQLAIDDAANQLAGLSERTAAAWGQLGNSGETRYR
jgi:glycerate 2-kinase